MGLGDLVMVNDGSPLGCFIVLAMICMCAGIAAACYSQDWSWLWMVLMAVAFQWMAYGIGKSTSESPGIDAKAQIPTSDTVDIEPPSERLRMQNTKLEQDCDALRQALEHYKQDATINYGRRYNEAKLALEKDRATLDKEILQFHEQQELIELEKAGMERMHREKLKQDLAELWNVSWAEKSAGFPGLAAKSAEAWATTWIGRIESIPRKAPVTAGEMKKMLSQEVRQIKAQARVHENLVQFYEGLFPELTALKEGEVPTLAEVNISQEHGKDFMSAQEWDELDDTARSQLALERYCARKKAKWEIGLEYERYCGWRFEERGWQVEYHGAVRGLNDLGRDLIARKDGKIYVVQCKYWADHKEIHEKHVFQTFGTMMALRLDEPELFIRAKLMTSTKLSERAKRFAQVLKIELTEEDKIQPFPRIKCNAASMIYHLPFDQAYDRLKTGYFYCWTVKEAEGKGFRRAWKWKG